jgi:hypothetical protein
MTDGNEHSWVYELDSPVAWDRVAEPQVDQYDTLISLELAKARGYIREQASGVPTLFDGAVAILHDSPLLTPYCEPAPPDHPNLKRGCDLIRHWPTVFRQFQLLVESVSPFVDTLDRSDHVVGSISGGWGGMYRIRALINNHVGFAEGLVHEMAHHKLRALGVEFEAAERIILNPSVQKFKSPIRHDRLRPMTAVLHAQYSYTYVTALDIEIIKAGAEPERDRLIAQFSLAKNIPKLQYGSKIITEGAVLDQAGEAFMQGYHRWLDRILGEASHVFDRLQIVPKPFTHPLEGVSDNAGIGRRGRPCRLKSVKDYCVMDEVLLYSPQAQMAFSLNSSARAVWELCDGEHTALEICEELQKSFDVSHERMIVEVQETIRRLEELQLLESGDAT